MKRILFATAALLALATTPVMADVIDPLHGTCLVGCVANAGPPPNISIPNPPLNFGFQASPGQLGPPPGGLTMDFLVPIADGIPGSISVTGTMGGALSFTANLFSATPWTTGFLDSYLGIAAQPNNPLDAIAASGCDAMGNNCTGFFVVQGFAGNYNIPQQGTDLTLGTTPLWSIPGGIPIGSSIVAFFNNGTSILATANSSALNVASVPGPIVGAGLPGLVTALFGMLGLQRWRRKRNGVIA
jgi:hypothetical protein